MGLIRFWANLRRGARLLRILSKTGEREDELDHLIEDCKAQRDYFNCAGPKPAE